MKKIMSLVMVIAMILTVTVYASTDNMVVDVKGFVFTDGDMSEEAMALRKANFSVSNVTKQVDTWEKYDELVYVYEAVAPVEVTLLDEGGKISAYNAILSENKEFTTVGEEIYPDKGQAAIMADDESGQTDEFGFPELVTKIIDISELKNNSDLDDFPHYIPGCVITLTEPGNYYVNFVKEGSAGAAMAIIKVTSADVETTPENEEPQEVIADNVDAIPTNSKVKVNDAEVSFDAYNINGNNYFKLRDLASVFNSTEKQFEVEWDAEKNAINLISNESYTSVGGEMINGNGDVKTGILNTSTIYKDGVEVKFTAYNINGNNYFKLRDVASAFNIGVEWDNETSTIYINTAQDYIEE